MTEDFPLPGFWTDGDLTIRKLARDEVPYAIFEGTVPSREQADRIVHQGFGLHLVQVPAQMRDLAFLNLFDGLTHLGVVGVGLDPHPITSLTSLRTLELSIADGPPVDLSGLSQLRRFSGFYPDNRSVLDAPVLAEAEFQEVGRSVVPPLPRQLEQLSLVGARSLSALSPRAHDPALKSLVVDSARSFDARSLLSFPRLEFVSFVRVGVLENSEALLGLPLRELGLLSCRSIPGVEALGALQGVSVTVVGRGASVLRDAPKHPSADWTFLSRI